MGNLLAAFKLGVAGYRADPTSMESYDHFRECLQLRHAEHSLSERFIRDAYEQWRRKNIETEVRASLGKVALAALAHDWRIRLDLGAIMLLVLAVLFPPFSYVTSSDCLHLGFSFAFQNRAGVVNASYLACELGAITLCYGVARQLLRAWLVGGSPKQT